MTNTCCLERTLDVYELTMSYGSLFNGHITILAEVQIEALIINVHDTLYETIFFFSFD